MSTDFTITEANKNDAVSLETAKARTSVEAAALREDDVAVGAEKRSNRECEEHSQIQSDSRERPTPVRG